jgi:aryl-alcohol dehydrogenase-like predicted oxidoreductase
MQYRELGNSGIRVSEIGFGGWGIGGWGEIDDSEARRALDRAFDLGVTFYDTALGYGDGHSEELIGAAFKKRRDRVVIASKLPPKTEIWPVKPHEPLETTFPADWIVACTEKSLRQLGTDYLDVQQFHAWTDSYTYLDEWREAFLRLKEQGKIRAFGVSVNDWDAYGGANLASTGRVDSVQVIYNIFEQRPAEQLLPAALRGHTGIIVRVPFEEGLLTGRLTEPGYRFPDGDWRADWLTPERLAEATPRVEALKQFLGPDYPTLPALALRFILAHPAVSTVIPGMRRTAHVDANVAVSDGIPLDAATLEALKGHAFAHGWLYPWLV